MSEIGAIHPCQIPMKNPAGLSSSDDLVPGRQDVMRIKTSNTIIPIMLIRIRCVFINSPFCITVKHVQSATHSLHSVHGTYDIIMCGGFSSYGYYRIQRQS